MISIQHPASVCNDSQGSPSPTPHYSGHYLFSMRHQQITTLFPNLGPKATPHPPQIGLHFFLCMRMPYCGKLASGKLNSPSSRSSKLAPPPTGNRTSPVHHSNLHWQNRGLATNLSKRSTKFILRHPSCKTSGERSLRWSVWIQSPSFSYHMPGRTSAWIFEQVCSHLVYLGELNSDFFSPNQFAAPAATI